jgi:hypothetical protein
MGWCAQAGRPSDTAISDRDRSRSSTARAGSSFAVDCAPLSGNCSRGPVSLPIRCVRHEVGRQKAASALKTKADRRRGAPAAGQKSLRKR